MEKSRHFAGIDLVRFLSAMIVMFHHLGFVAWTTYASPVVQIVAPPPGARPPAFDFWLGSFGWVGVQIFFVVSGLVIANSAVASTPIGFAKSRIYRLYPAVWICATISAGIYLSLGLKHSLLLHYIGAMLLVPMAGFAVYWTLGAEVVFYATVFLWKLRIPAVSLQRLAICLTVWSGAYLVARMLGWQGVPTFFERVLLMRFGIFFALGVFLWGCTERRPTPVQIALIAITLVLCVYEVALSTTDGPIIFPIVTWLIAVFLIVVSTTKMVSTMALPASTASILRTLGLMTYPLYLFHDEVGSVGVRVFLRAGFAPGLAIALGMLVAVAMAYFVAAFGEKMIRRQLRRWVERITMPRYATGRPMPPFIISLRTLFRCLVKALPR